MIDYKLEYENLRKESDTNKNYVFERPILIVTVSLATINFGANDYISYVPAFITILLCFNLLFTVNRLYSSARIIAYITLVIERNYKPYYGWENMLHFHREFTHKIGKKRIKEIVNSELKKEFIPKGYGFYPLIYYFHVFVLIITYSSLFIKVKNLSCLVIVISLITILYFVYLLLKYNNNKMRKNLLYENIILEKVLQYAADNKFLDELIIQYPN